GDGIGDLAGIIERADYLPWLGVDAVWISPFYPSPMADFGYDVSDFTGVDPMFGTLADFDRLVEALHARGIRVILDFVPNHSSDQHPWFVASRRSRDDPKRDWYVWRDPAPDGGPPNNWVSMAGGGAWQYDDATGQYYLHSFLKEQPDLNWRNPAVREAMHDVLRFWLERGVDGFRVDVLWYLAKDPEFRDEPLNPDYREGVDPPFKRLLMQNSCDHPDMIGLAAEMRRVIDSYPGERLFIGEIGLPMQRVVAYYGPQLDACHLPFNFALIWATWKPEAVARLIADYEAALPPCAWPNWVLGNHDQPRVASRVGPAQARVAMMLLLTLRGTPTLYNGDELGLESVAIPPDKVQDPFSSVPGQGRDPYRTPMPWTTGPNAGFTTAEPWLPLGADHPARSVAAQREDPASMLSLTRALLRLRRQEPALQLGDWRLLAADEAVLAYERRWEGRRCTVLLNLTAEPRTVSLGPEAGGTVAVSTRPDRAGENAAGSVALRGDEGLVITSS
ncbi:MAG: alpha-amylase family glycosyl hydrolase, partial [Geminicoccaceae bacterium]